MEISVRFAGAPPTWAATRDFLETRGKPFQVCMIDGELAFPDEEPPLTWKELRLRTPDGMITVRRDPDRLVLVTWGNAEKNLLEQRDELARAFAQLGSGTIEVEGPL